MKKEMGVREEAGWMVFGVVLGGVAYFFGWLVDIVGNVKFGILCGLLAILTTTSGCSFQVEMGYHGQTGRDDRTQTQLVRGGASIRNAKDDERY